MSGTRVPAKKCPLGLLCAPALTDMARAVTRIRYKVCAPSAAERGEHGGHCPAEHHLEESRAALTDWKIGRK